MRPIGKVMVIFWSIRVNKASLTTQRQVRLWRELVKLDDPEVGG